MFRWDDRDAVSQVVWTLDDAPGGTRVIVEERPLVALDAVAGVNIDSWTPWPARLTGLARAAAFVAA